MKAQEFTRTLLSLIITDNFTSKNGNNQAQAIQQKQYMAKAHYNILLGALIFKAITFGQL